MNLDKFESKIKELKENGYNKIGIEDRDKCISEPELFEIDEDGVILLRDKHRNTRKVKALYDYKFHGIDCMISEDKKTIAFYKDDNDVRPSSATYIDLETAEKLYELFSQKAFSRGYATGRKEK